MTQQQGIILTQASVGGIPEGNMEILDAAFCEWNYNGALDHNILALGVQYQDDSGKTYDQFYSAGELTFFVPSDDGSTAVPVADKSMLTDSCNAWKFISSLIEVGGEPMVELLGRSNVKELVGMRLTLQAFAQPKRQGLIRGGKDPEKDKQVSLAIAILAWPGQAEAATPAPAPAKKTGLGGAGKPVQGRPTQAPAAKPGLGGKPTGASGAAKPPGTAATPAKATSPSKVNGQAGAATVAEPSGDIREKAVEALQAILIEAEGGTISKKELAPKAFQKAGQMVKEGKLHAKLHTELVQLIFQDAFLHELAQAGTIVFDGSKVSFPS